ncbi:MAG: NAAT family transporter [Methanomassiliicoccales archaeon]|nr:MAG: NAAT family transporter [Methanomassiliicoccales archaeon]
MGLEFALTAFASIFAILNPIGNIPVYVAITEGYTPEQKRRVRNKVCIVSGGVLFVFAILGNYIFDIYGITIPAFKIAGGLLLFSISYSMVRGQLSNTKITPAEHDEAASKEEVGVVPLGIPLFAGPGAITTVMIYISYALDSSDAAFDIFAVFLGIFLTVVISYFLLKYSDAIFARMGKSGAAAFSRIMGLLLAAIAIEFVLSGSFQAVEEFWHVSPLAL